MYIYVYICASATYLDTEIPACQNPCGDKEQVEHALTSMHTPTDTYMYMHTTACAALNVKCCLPSLCGAEGRNKVKD